MQLQEGDIKLVYTDDDGFDVELENGILTMDGSFSTAVYLSLFGCSNSNWMNNIFSNYEKLDCKFYKFMMSEPLTIQSLRTSENYILQDLDWLKKTNACDKITVSSELQARNRVNFSISIFANSELLYKNDYAVNWNNQAGGLNGN